MIEALTAEIVVSEPPESLLVRQLCPADAVPMLEELVHARAARIVLGDHRVKFFQEVGAGRVPPNHFAELLFDLRPEHLN